MSVRNNHVPVDRLTALAFIARAPEDDSADSGRDRDALNHVGRCDRCAAELSRLTIQAEGLRDAALAAVDTMFDDSMLEAQRNRILDRLAHLGKAARVLSFPRRRRDAAMPVTTGSPRWVSVAAAAGLIIGLLAGQMLHFVPWNPSGRRDDSILTIQAPGRQAGPAMVTVAATVPALSDDELLDEVEAAVRLPRARSLRALDGLTPGASDLSTMGR